MPKFTIGEGDNKQEVEISNEQILEKFDVSEPSVLEKLLQKLKIKPSKKEESEKADKDESKKEESKVSGVDPELKEILKKQNETIEAMSQKFEKYDKIMEDEKKSEKEQKADKLLKDAVSEGRIAPGEVDEWKKKFKEKYGENPEILEDVVKARQVDEKLKQEASKNQKPEADSDDKKEGSKKDRGGGGVPTFKQSQLRDPKFFEENEKDIEKAYAAGQIIRDIDE